MVNSHSGHSSAINKLWKFLLVVLLLALSIGIASQADTSPAETNAAPPSWLEPRGLNIVNLVGLVPDADLQGVTMVYDVGNASVTYISGTRTASEVTVKVSINSNNPSKVYCLGAKPINDHGFNVAPSSSMRVFKGTTDITNEIQSSYTLFPAAYVQPNNNTVSQLGRYASQAATTSVNADGSIAVPANMGCTFSLNGVSGPYTNITAEFKMAATNNIQVTETYHHTNTKVHGYIGSGFAGNLASLQSQMQAYHDSLPSGRSSFLHDPILTFTPDDEDVEARVSWANREKIIESDYVLVKYDKAYDQNAAVPGATNNANALGTVRFKYTQFNTSDYSSVSIPSIDYFDGMLMPRSLHWRDADQQAGQNFLNEFETMYEHGSEWWDNQDRITAPELFLPPGINYHPCMSSGGCSNALKAQIYNHTYTVEVFFYKIEAYEASSNEQVCLRSVGPAFSPAPAAPRIATKNVQSARVTAAPSFKVASSVFLPILQSPLLIQNANPLPQCPRASGTFDTEGQMIDYEPSPIVYTPANPAWYSNP